MDALISINPATLSEVGRVPITTPEELDVAVRRANDVFVDWRTDRAFRQKLMRACSEALTQRTTEIVPLLVAEQGKTAAEAGGEIWVSARHFAHAADSDWADEEPGPDAPGRHARIQRIPLGTVAAVVPWNFPVFLTVAKIAPALAAGNTVVVKPAESVSLVVDKVVQILAEILPDGVLQIVHGGPDIGRALVEHPLIRKVSFTGSTQVGKLIMRQAAESITPVTLELGGNDPAIVLDDADVALAAQSLARSAFFNAGQMCVAPKRAYVPTGKVDEFCQVFADQIAGATVGDGSDPDTTMGPLHNTAQRNFVQQLLDDAVARGATIVAGGGRGTELPGHFLEPTLVRGVDDSFDLVALEQFGPVFPVIAYTNLDDVLDTVNDQEFGLGASVWGVDDDAATAVAERIDAGSVWVNQHNAVEVELPFGGIKSSGFGREGGLAGIEDYLQTRVISIRSQS
ncbi:aldehyde dehydrogenase family protein [Tomitella fengzijianii]|uniref:aldehyde dehydrogenase family protein n=1 Tax=Tomitella fengzijianii TaxID=2597660 RepID=UPI00131D41CE|nr:aldehyde dehydrogenase family protein [Tomitella fengzijianii]